MKEDTEDVPIYTTIDGLDKPMVHKFNQGITGEMNRQLNEQIHTIVNTLNGSITKEFHKDITCKELFEEMH